MSIKGLKKISIKDVEGFRFGNAEDREGGTGLTVIVCEKGASAGLSISGGGPASRESQLLSPLTNEVLINAVVLGGGSAFGLDAAGGVQQYLEERGIGYDVGVTSIPLVCQSDIFDLLAGSSEARPDKKMGYEACENAFKGNYRDGCFGAGTGATVGKYYSSKRAMKSGVGSYAVQIGDFQLGAVVVVNSFGDVFDSESGERIAGLLNADGTALADTASLMYEDFKLVKNKFTGNTTIGCIVTNADFDKTRLCKIAAMANNGYARSIFPLNTTADGDSIYVMSCGGIEADPDVVGSLAAEVISKAIVRAIDSAESAYGYKARRDL